MTRLSPTKLYRCPACAGCFTRSGLSSLHFHADVPEWSDGKNEQWWADIGAPAGRCPTCLAFIWIHDVPEWMPAPVEPRPIGRMSRLWHRLTGDRHGRIRAEREWAALDPALKNAESLVGLRTTQDFVDALAQMAPMAPDQEEYLRRKLWWSANDHLRQGDANPTLDAQAARANMERLLALLSSAARTLERVELCRQLGRFREALDLVALLTPEERMKADLQRQWIAAGDSTVRLIPPEVIVRARQTQRGAVVF